MPLAERRIHPRAGQTAPGTATTATQSGYPATRMRRNRKADWTPRLVAEHRFATSDLVWPIFLIDGAE